MLRGWPNAVGAPGSVQMCRRRAGGGYLRRVALRGAHIGDGLYQGGQPQNERNLGVRGIVQGWRGGGQQPGCPAEAGTCPGVAGGTPIGEPGGAGIGIGGPAKLLAAECRRGGMQSVRSGPSGVGSGARIGTGEAPDLGGRAAGRLRGVFPDRVSLGGGELIPGAAPLAAQR